VLAEPRPELHADKILRRLTERGVDFVVVGGIAAVLHGSPRITQDLDICYATDRANLQALGEVLVDLKARLKGVEEDVPFVPDASTLRRVELLTMMTSAGELDVLALPPGALRFSTLRRNAERFDLGGYSVLVASIADLVAMKRVAGRTKDLADIEELEAIKRLRTRTGAG
jgi:Nucleotidyl transferase AbiEii toxin, Type IV TA system